MRRVILAALALVVLAGVARAQYSGGGQHILSVTDERLDRDALLRDRYEQQPSTVVGRVCAIFHDGHDSFYEYAVALSDSIRLGLGDWEDSTAIVGQDIRLTVAIMPTQIGTANMMTADEVRYVDAHPSYEVASHGPDTERLGAFGVASGVNAGVVSIGGVSGMKEELLDKAFEVYQDSAQVWGIKPFRTHVPANWKYQGGVEWLMEKHGYTGQVTLSVAVYQSEATETNDLSAMTRNDDAFLPNLFGQGTSIYWGSGFHTIGEPLNRFDVGQNNSYRYAQDGGGFGTGDSLKKVTDMAGWYGDGLIQSFHQIEPDTGDMNDAIDILYSTLRGWFIYLAHQQAAGVIKTVTAEQFIDWAAGYRVGELMTTGRHSFRMLRDNTESSHWGTLTPTPYGLMPPGGHPNMYADVTGDTILAYGAASGGTYKIVNASTEEDTVASGNTSADSLTYGLSGPDENYLVSRTTLTESTTDLRFLIRTTGVGRRTSYIRLAVQYMLVYVDRGGTQVHAELFATPWEEKWADHVNQGGNDGDQYELMAKATHSFGATPTLLNPQAYRVQPRYLYGTADTTAAYPANVGTTSVEILQQQYAGHWFPVQHFVTAASGDSWLLPYGDALGGADADGTYLADARDADQHNRPYNAYFYLKVDPWTDYYYCVFNIVASGTAFSSSQMYAILNISARAL